MLSVYLWSSYHLCFYPQSQQEDRSHHPCGGLGVEQVKWVCDRLYYCLGDGGSVFHSRRDTDLLPDRGPSLWGLAQLCIYIYISLFKRGWSDVHKLMLVNAYLVPKHGTEWTCLVKSSGMC